MLVYGLVHMNKKPQSCIYVIHTIYKYHIPIITIIIPIITTGLLSFEFFLVNKSAIKLMVIDLMIKEFKDHRYINLLFHEKSIIFIILVHHEKYSL